MGEIVFDNEICATAIDNTTNVATEINNIITLFDFLTIPDADISGLVNNIKSDIMDLHTQALNIVDAIINVLLELQQTEGMEVNIDISTITKYSSIDIDINSINFTEAIKTEEGKQAAASTLVFEKDKKGMFDFILKNKDNKKMSKEDKAKYEIIMYYFANYDPKSLEYYVDMKKNSLNKDLSNAQIKKDSADKWSEQTKYGNKIMDLDTQIQGLDDFYTTTLYKYNEELKKKVNAGKKLYNSMVSGIDDRFKFEDDKISGDQRNRLDVQKNNMMAAVDMLNMYHKDGLLTSADVDAFYASLVTDSNIDWYHLKNTDSYTFLSNKADITEVKNIAKNIAKENNIFKKTMKASGLAISSGASSYMHGLGQWFTNKAIAPSTSQQALSYFQEYSNNGWNTMTNVESSITTMALSMATEAVTQVPAVFWMSASAGGNTKTEALNAGYSATTANVRGLISFGTNYVLESFVGGALGKGGTFLGDGINKVSSKVIGSTVGDIIDTGIKSGIVKTGLKLIGNEALDMVAEGTEEGIQTILEPHINNMLYGTNDKVTFKDVKDSFVVGALSSVGLHGLVGAPSAVINVGNNVMNTGSLSGGIQSLAVNSDYINAINKLDNRVYKDNMNVSQILNFNNSLNEQIKNYNDSISNNDYTNARKSIDSINKLVAENTRTQTLGETMKTDISNMTSTVKSKANDIISKFKTDSNSVSNASAYVTPSISIFNNFEPVLTADENYTSEQGNNYNINDTNNNQYSNGEILNFIHTYDNILNNVYYGIVDDIEDNINNIDNNLKQELFNKLNDIVYKFNNSGTIDYNAIDTVCNIINESVINTKLNSIKDMIYEINQDKTKNSLLEGYINSYKTIIDHINNKSSSSSILMEVNMLYGNIKTFYDEFYDIFNNNFQSKINYFVNNVNSNVLNPEIIELLGENIYNLNSEQQLIANKLKSLINFRVLNKIVNIENMHDWNNLGINVNSYYYYLNDLYNKLCNNQDTTNIVKEINNFDNYILGEEALANFAGSIYTYYGGNINIIIDILNGKNIDTQFVDYDFKSYYNLNEFRNKLLNFTRDGKTINIAAINRFYSYYCNIYNNNYNFIRNKGMLSLDEQFNNINNQYGNVQSAVGKYFGSVNAVGKYFGSVNIGQEFDNGRTDIFMGIIPIGRKFKNLMYYVQTQIFPGMDDTTAARFLSIINENGACSYVAVLNQLMKLLSDREFYEIFSVNKYNMKKHNKITLDNTYTLTKLFAYMNYNPETNNSLIYKDSSGNWKIKDKVLKSKLYKCDNTDKYINDQFYFQIDGSTDAALEKFLSDNSKYKYKVTSTIINTPTNISILKQSIIQELSNGEYMQINVPATEKNPLLMYIEGRGSYKLSGAHAMTITGITPDNKLIVSTWGQKAYINFSELYKSGFYISKISIKNLGLKTEVDTNTVIENANNLSNSSNINFNSVNNNPTSTFSNIDSNNLEDNIEIIDDAPKNIINIYDYLNELNTNPSFELEYDNSINDIFNNSYYRDIYNSIQIIKNISPKLVTLYLNARNTGLRKNFFLGFEEHNFVHVKRVADESKKMSKILNQMINNGNLNNNIFCNVDEDIIYMSGIVHDLGMSDDIGYYLSDNNLEKFKSMGYDIQQETSGTYSVINKEKRERLSQDQVIQIAEALNLNIQFDINGNIKSDENIYVINDDEGKIYRKFHPFNSAIKILNNKDIFGDNSEMIACLALIHSKSTSGVNNVIQESQLSYMIKKLYDNQTINNKKIYDFDISKLVEVDQNGVPLTHQIIENNKVINVYNFKDNILGKLRTGAIALRVGDAHALKTGYNHGGGKISIEKSATIDEVLKYIYNGGSDSTIIDSIIDFEESQSDIYILYPDNEVNLSLSDDGRFSKKIILGESNVISLPTYNENDTIVYSFKVNTSNAPACTFKYGIKEKFGEYATYKDAAKQKVIIKLPSNSPDELVNIYNEFANDYLFEKNNQWLSIEVTREES